MRHLKILPLRLCSFSIFAALTLAATTLPALSEPVVTIRADQWAPFSGEPDSDRPGIMIDIAKKVFERKGVKVDYKLMPWSRVLKEVGEGVYDGAAGASLDDAPDFLYTKEPQGMWTVACIVRGDDTTFSFKDLKGLDKLQLGAMLGYVYGKTASGEDIDKYIESHKGKNVQQLSGDFPLKTAIEMLQRGRLNVVLETPEVFFDAVDTLKLPRSQFKIGAEVRPRSPVYIGFSPKKEGAKEYVKMLDEGMTWLKESGELSKILAKYQVQDWTH